MRYLEYPQYAKYLLKSKFSYLLFYNNPTHKQKTETANRWEKLLIINHVDQSEIGSSSQIILIAVLSGRFIIVLCISPAWANGAKNAGPKPFCWVKSEPCFDFSSSSFNVQCPILSTAGDALRLARGIGWDKQTSLFWTNWCRFTLVLVQKFGAQSLQLSYYFAAAKSVVGDSLLVGRRVSARCAFFWLFAALAQINNLYMCLWLPSSAWALSLWKLYCWSLLLLYCFCSVIASVVFFSFLIWFWKWVCLESCSWVCCGAWLW